MGNKLFAVYLGGKHDNGFMEDHDIVFVVAQNQADAKRVAKQKTKIKEDLHFDGIAEIKNVDGYDIKLVSGGNSESIEYDKKYQKE